MANNENDDRFSFNIVKNFYDFSMSIFGSNCFRVAIEKMKHEQAKLREYSRPRQSSDGNRDTHTPMW